ncbi:MAG TPA: ComF family protein [Candidatus Moranbacteria bacterium]|nr:ComF family protein [Candidatus Moranbacteria bacterium]
MNFLENFKKFLLDTLFPIECLSCNKSDDWICDDCLNKISIKNHQTCPLCKQIETPNGNTCFDCREKFSLDGLLVASFYRRNKHKTILAQLIHFYKYRFVSELNNPLGEILKKAFLNSNLILPDFIIPIPLHHRRLRWRNFNQSKLLANYLSVNLTPGFKIDLLENVIIRKKYTQPQAKIKNRQQRIKNLQGIFAINKNSTDFKLIKNKTILLVDDVATTGSTLFECAKALKQNHVKKVYAIVLARQ